MTVTSTIRLEYEDTSSHKFWEVNRDDTNLTYEVRWGKIGHKGASTTYGPFKSEYMMSVDIGKKIATKLKKGYKCIQTNKASVQSQVVTHEFYRDVPKENWTYVLDLSDDY